MRFGLFLPIFDELADPSLLAELAAEAEESGWDAVFLWDHVYYRGPTSRATDPWIAMAAIATRTSRILIGPLVTPLARRRPQVIARQAVALDHLSHGRLVLGVGLGLDNSGGEFSRFGEETDDAIRAEMLDESLDLIRLLLSGERVDYRGRHYTATDVRFLPRPVNGRIPIWAAARWPNRRPLRRAAMCDGLFLIDVANPTEVTEALQVVGELRPTDAQPIDVAVRAIPGVDPGLWDEAGATWWLAAFDPFTVTAGVVRTVIASRPVAVACRRADVSRRPRRRHHRGCVLAGPRGWSFGRPTRLSVSAFWGVRGSRCASLSV